ncbi:unnamed protein product [Triticum turgidum subsp. durum]|uniref:Uncharacterized protein n=1 Tax=Triticum turgidum subsp. durum TaxID=4567 RepID=A0A9R1BPG7_TRITD|nr:unnamed protein product [Triticum turgidum subsp. durum]
MAAGSCFLAVRRVEVEAGFCFLTVIHVQVIVKKNIVCDGPMRKKYKSTMLLMGGTDSPNAFALGSLFKLIFSYNKKEDAEGGIATRKTI